VAEGRVSPGDRNDLVVDARLTHTTGTTEPEAALASHLLKAIATLRLKDSPADDPVCSLPQQGEFY
jgi:hypothetical protein